MSIYEQPLCKVIFECELKTVEVPYSSKFLWKFNGKNFVTAAYLRITIACVQAPVTIKYFCEWRANHEILYHDSWNNTANRVSF